MLRFSKKLDYALISIFEIADRNGQLPVSAKSIAMRYEIPLELLGKVLQTLAKNGLVTSIQGVKGGYVLNHSLRDVSILQVVEAIEGPISLTACHNENICLCNQHTNCNIRTPMAMIQYELEQFFESISLEELRNRNLRTHAQLFNRV
ncbi:MAG: Rrf2 family transcriptional regulator [Calditrichaceae bacterium]|nr:Rrf2 family transcriptional regulator [Calditrichaceae bacterium]